MTTKARIEVLGDSSSYQRAVKEAAVVTDKLGVDMKKLGVSAKSSADAQIKASIRKDARLREEIAAYKRVASAAEVGSKEQVVAANLAAQGQKRLQHSLGVTEAEANKLNRSLRSGERDAGRFGRGVLAGSGALGHFGRSAIFASNSVLGGVGLAFAFRALISSAATMQEETEKTGVVFGKSADNVQAWAGTLATSFGVGEGAALKASGTFGNMFRSLSFGEKPAATMSKRLVELAADMASFNNASPADTLEALQSGLAGQVRPLRQFGVFLSDARLRHEAFRLGIYNGKGVLSASQKVLASYNLILKDTKLQQGDVARNTGSLSVAQSKLTASLQDSEAIIGRALLPTMASLANTAATYLDRLNKTGRLQRDVNSAVKTTKEILGGVKDVLSPIVSGFKLLGDAVGGTRNEIKLLGTAFLILETRAKLIKWGLITTGIETVGTEAAVSSGKVSALAGTLGKLKALGIITVGVEILIHRKDIGDKVGNIFHGLTGSKKVGDIANLLERAGIDAANPPTAAKDIVDAFRGSTPKSTGPSDIQKQIAAENAFLAKQRRGQPSVTGSAAAGATAKPLSLVGRFNLAELRLANAQLTKTSADDRAILLTEAAIVRQQVAGAKKLKDRIQLTQQLAGILGQIQGIDDAAVTSEKQAAAAAKDRAKATRERAKAAREHTLAVLQARQFRVLGLDASGSPLTPGARSLRRELGNVSDAVSGTFLDTNKTKSVLAKIRRVLGGGLGALSKDVRSTVKQMLDDLDQQLKDHSGPETRFKAVSTNQILAGLGLNPAQTREARARLSQLGTGGTVPATSHAAHNTAQVTTVIHTHFMLDGREVAVNTTRHQQKAGRRNPPQKRGAFAGGGR